MALRGIGYAATRGHYVMYPYKPYEMYLSTTKITKMSELSFIYHLAPTLTNIEVKVMLILSALLI